MFLGRVIGDLGATVSAALVVIGDRLGLYRAMADGTPSPPRAGRRTGTARYVRPWLANQAAGGYVDVRRGHPHLVDDPRAGLALAAPDGPAVLRPAACSSRSACYATSPPSRSGSAPAPASAGTSTTPASSRAPSGSSAPVTSPTSSRLAARPRRRGRPLTAGAPVADVGCGHGASTILMAQAFPGSTFVGTDYHEASIVVARRHAAAAGVAANASPSRRRRHRAARRVRPHDHVRLPARHGRPGRRGPPASAPRSPPTAPSCSSNRRPATGSRTTCTPSAGSSTAPPPSSARRARWPSPVGAPRPAGRTRLLTVFLPEAGFRDARIAVTTPTNLVLEARD